MNSVPRVILKGGEEGRIEKGHPWIYDNEIERVEGETVAGSVVDVESSRMRYLGRGFLNPNSKIRVRLSSRSKDGIDPGYFKRRIREALAYRSAFLDTERDSFRLVFGEADFLPGLIVDAFRDHSALVGKGPEASGGIPQLCLSVQFLSLGLDVRKMELVRAMKEILSPAGIMERSDAPVRELEGLPLVKGILEGRVPNTVLIRENGLFFEADLAEGQKTGWFFDQRENRAAAAPYSKGRKAMDAFCHTGGFAIHAAASGAESVLAVDASEEALKLVERNAAANGLSGKITAKRANVFDLLHELERGKEKFGFIVLDPPAFAKGRSQVEGALRGYKEINYRAMRLLDRGGYLASCSCSHFIGEELFLKMLIESARDADRPVRIVEIRGQAKDHPILLGYEESRYLKCVLMQAL